MNPSSNNNAPACHSPLKVVTGKMPFRGFETYYRIVGEKTDKAPLLLLHGGPGSTHNYFEVLDELALTTGRQVISYDQIGCGESYVEGHPELWNLQTWQDELDALREHLGLDHVHLLGQSWGGMLIIGYLIDRQPQGIESIILSSTLSSSSLWGREQQRLISFMPEEEQRAIARAVATGNYDDPDYLTGTLKNFEYTDQLGEITQRTLVISGTNDECTPLIAKAMYDGIPNARWELLDGARHMTFIDQTDNYKRILTDWLNTDQA